MDTTELPIAVVASRVRREERLILQTMHRRGLRFEHVDPRRLTVLLADGRPPFRAALMREVSHSRASSVASTLAALGVPTLNRPEVLDTCGDKLRTALAFHREGLPIPQAAVAWGTPAALDAMPKLGYPVVVKPVTGSWGHLTARVYDEEQGRTVLEHRAALPNPQQHVFYLQEHIDKPGRDIKSYVAGGEVVCAIYKNAVDDWRTNTAIGGAPTPCPITAELNDLAVAAARAVGGGFLGVDILIDQQGRMFANEVNHTPEFHGAIDATGVDVAGCIVDWLVAALEEMER
ncbi:lysine biosynthesis protein LysX [Dactylosporangium aurantiacum]|uniref:Lysine biosynthesis protein LysX n=1 Tax=Dactylosporangium aurantiacum TaxID=35754 RepID=A0A9Q9IJY6_9ACTN|nr:lysine biosynthesis protein LysX [Dactylosporangium aurantiacum]MDG6103027.1 lysine biosynthesis protein LysX [Dactylosporangium aurantiacum]UWZ57539.1 lysine biosynthesis protein LysX [Dactylosporangium aurantiacum]